MDLKFTNLAKSKQGLPNDTKALRNGSRLNKKLLTIKGPI
jgi:hypothetical protein